ncbi:MAG: ABC transporter transmembrane domain-containing protein, partial [Rhizobiaceae bacterium]
MTQRIYSLFENWLVPFEEPPDLQPPSALIPYIWHYARQAKGPFLLMIVAGGLSPLIDAGLFYFVGRLVDILNDLGGPRSWAQLWAHSGPELLFMLLTVLVGRTLVLFLAALVDEQTVTPGFYNLVRWQSHRHVSRQSYQFFQDELSGSIANKVWQNGQAMGDLLESLITVIWFMIIYSCTTLATLAMLDLRLAGLVVLWIAGFAFLARWYLPTIRRQAERSAEANSAVTGRIVDGYSNVETLKLFAADGHDRFIRNGFEKYLEAYLAFTRSLTSVRTALALLSGAMIVVIAWFSIDLWIGNVITVGAVTFTLGLVLRLNMLLSRLMTQLNSILRTLGVLENAKELIAQPLGLTDRPDARLLEVTRGEIRIEDVVFNYGRASGVLEGIDLTIRPGEKVGLIGPS